MLVPIMSDTDSKFSSYLTKLIELSERKMQIERATATTYRAARRDHVSVEQLKAKMKEQFYVLKDRSSKIMKATVEKEKATIAPPPLQDYAGEIESVFGDVEMDDLIGR